MNILGRTAPALMNRRIALGFIAALVLIAVGFIISFYSYHQYSQDTERVRHTYEVIGALDETLSLLKDVEAGARGYVITKDSSFLEPYQTSVTALPGHMNRLRLLLKDNRVQLNRVTKIDTLIQTKLAVTQVRIGVASTDKTNGFKLIREAKRYMDDIRWQISVMVETERSLVEVWSRQATRSFRHTLIIIFALSLLTFLTVVVLYRLLEAELLRRQENEDQLRDYERRLKEQIRQLEASNEELERFAFVASHDLQEPLRKIQAFSNLITDRYGSLFEGDSLLFMRKIGASAERMSKLIKDLLNFSRISSHREDFKPVRLNEVIQRILDDQELRIKGLGVRVEVGPLPTIYAVTSQMDHLFTNLISNALKFIRPDVEPVLRISATPVDGAEYPGLVAGRNYFEFTVEDNGIGFDEKYLDHIFKVFQRLHGKSEFEGTGIGLAICKRVVVYHQGYITARSKPKQGTSFVIVLPESHPLHNHDRTKSTEAYSYSAG
ncbi:signal transduction histidine kinase [Spirosoma lacussanchae]|uniref:sensor histidine kinase n=1 Tax=Spirosoma lacussanchae TaxID=1884249 RepID=UPI001FE94F40|nr:sensor histidine kinase [Spirosoma lacussanchae]